MRAHVVGGKGLVLDEDFVTLGRRSVERQLRGMKLACAIT